MVPLVPFLPPGLESGVKIPGERGVLSRKVEKPRTPPGLSGARLAKSVWTERRFEAEPVVFSCDFGEGRMPIFWSCSVWLLVGG